MFHDSCLVPSESSEEKKTVLKIFLFIKVRKEINQHGGRTKQFVCSQLTDIGGIRLVFL
jgi:hypothetical protein